MTVSGASDNPKALPVGTLILDPDDHGRPRLWTVVAARTIISATEGVSIRATLHKTGLPTGWRKVNSVALAKHIMEVFGSNDATG